MKVNRSYWRGLLIVFIGSAISEIAIMKASPQHPMNKGMAWTGLLIVAIGGYVMYKGKKAQQSERDQ